MLNGIIRALWSMLGVVVGLIAIFFFGSSSGISWIDSSIFVGSSSGISWVDSSILCGV